MPPETEAKEAIWHLAASKRLIRESMSQLKFESGLEAGYRSVAVFSDALAHSVLVAKAKL
jgi:hypothetical protein